MLRTPSLFTTLLFTAGLASFATAVVIASRQATIPEASARTQAVPDSEATEVVRFWKEAGPTMWFAKDPAFDERFRTRFARAYEAAARGELGSWNRTSESALALVLLLDQYPRNSFRNTPKMYETDPLARSVARAAIDARLDLGIEEGLRLFLYLPLGHSEDLGDQERSVDLVRKLGQPHLAHAEQHRDIIRRFGRFPHRNPILGRVMRPEEQRYLDEGGFKG